MNIPIIPFPPRIIVIDDNPAIHDDFRKILCPEAETVVDELEADIFGEAESSGYLPEEYHVETALQGEEGLVKIRDAVTKGSPFSLAFIDGRMPPGWDGVETIQRIWKEIPDLQIVFCTAFSDYSWREVLSRIGGTDNLIILKKPFDNIEVAQLARTLSQKWALKQQIQFQTRNLQAKVEEKTREIRRTNLGLIVANDQLNAAMQVKNDFIANITHELRTPLQGILGAASLFGGGNPSSEDRELIGVINECSRALLGHIDNLVAVAEKGGVAPLTVSRFDLRDLIDGILGPHRQTIRDKGLLLRVDVRPSGSDQFVGHAIELSEVLDQLISNAAKFTEEGMITVAARVEGTGSQPRTLNVEVRDTGPGVPKDLRPDLFQPFSAGDSTTVKKHSGLGLGLTVCKLLAHRMAGTVSLKPNEHRGTVATLVVPEASSESRPE